jgi:serine protease Do
MRSIGRAGIASRSPLVVALTGVLLLGSATGVEASARRTPVVEAVQRVAPATVNITTESRVSRPVNNPFGRRDPFFDMFFEPLRQDVTEQMLGTGAIVDRRGYVLTNEHVLAGAEKIWVTLADGREFPGTVIGADPDNDLAVIKIESDAELPTAQLASGEELMIGETVIAIGNPFGLNHTVTTGVLSATNRSFRAGETEYHGFLQTDASINPGNSGGPLLNLDGEVIGINTAIFREAEGIGFAIPIERAKRIMDDLIAYGEVVPVWLGVRLAELTPELRQRFDVHSAGGVLIRDVYADSPAQRAGLEPGDVLVALDGTPLQSPRNYYEILRGLTEGYKARARIERKGKGEDRTVRAEVLPVSRAEELASAMLGFKVREMTTEELQVYGARGLVIEEVLPGNRAAQRLRGPGEVVLQPGDVVWALDRAPLADIDDYRRAVRKLPSLSQVILLVQRGRAREPLGMTLS